MQTDTPTQKQRRRRMSRDTGAQRLSLRSLLWLAAFGLAALAIVALTLTQGVSAAAVRTKGLFGAVLDYLRTQPFILLFTVVAAGYALGCVKVRGIGLGATGATLVVGLALSVWAAARHEIEYQIPAFASTIFFNLFMFAIGMKVGPQFIAGLRRDAGKFITLALFVPILSMLLMIGFGAVVDLAPGLGPGIFVGGNTATPGLGAARAAYDTGAVQLPAGVTKEVALGNLSTAFAFSYCISMVLFIVLMKVMPRLFGSDLVAEANKYEEGLKTAAPLPGAALGLLPESAIATSRAFKVDNPECLGRSLAELRALAPLVSVQRVKRGEQHLEPEDAVVLRADDVVVLYGRIEHIIAAARRVGAEVDAPELRGDAPETVEVVVHDKAVDGRTLGELAAGVGHGLVLNALFRAGEALPVGLDTRVHIGDVLRVTGGKPRIAELERHVGQVVRASLATDITTLAAGLALGAFLGAITVPVGNIKLTLGASVGLLLVGIALSTLRTRNPGLGGPFPEPARQLLEDLGLNIFIAILGLTSGLGVVTAVKDGALLPIVSGCLLVGFVPTILAWVIGQYWMKMNSALLLGGVAGARCNSAGMRAGQEASSSNVPAISYPVTFAISNVLFTFMAYLMVFVA